METVVWGFAPDTTDAPQGRREDLYDIIVTTDVLAEGVNLQQARHIINYDLPWNPMRLVQRHGRIDRIGSPHAEVFIRCVFPDARLDELLNLEERLQRKIHQVAASIGVGRVLPDQQGRDLSFAENREEIERIRREEPDLFERGGTTRGAISGEEYRQELRQAIEQGLLDQIRSLPWGSGSGMTARPDTVGLPGYAGTTNTTARPDTARPPGYVFCARIADSERVAFRYVQLQDNAQLGDDSDAINEPTVTDDTLDCLRRARPPAGPDTPRHLDDSTHKRAFHAWETARADILRKWNFLADKANLEPRVPAALAKASEILRCHPPAGLAQDQLDRAIDSLSSPHPERTVRTFRAAMASTENPTEQADKILGAIKALGLEPHVPPAALPEITPDDIHLVCWLALT